MMTIVVVIGEDLESLRSKQVGVLLQKPEFESVVIVLLSMKRAKASGERRFIAFVGMINFERAADENSEVNSVDDVDRFSEND